MLKTIDSYIDRQIGIKLLEISKVERAKHKSSGKLSAGSLADPLQWQILHSLGVPTKEIDEYVVRKFLRGNQIEEWLVAYLDAVETQKFVEYRGVVGYIDALCETKDWDWKNGIIPVEVKSVTNLKFKRIVSEGAQRGHVLQACLYALATENEHFAICYVASDDLRVHTFIFETAEFKEEIDGIITRYDETKLQGIIPKFEANEKWQESLTYNKYPEFMELSEEQLANKYMEIVK